MAKKHECLKYGKGYDAADEACVKCADAQECCKAAMKAEETKPDLPSPKKRKASKGKGQAMPQCFW